MTIHELRDTLSAQPFRPFLLHTADGRTLPVPHPDFLFVTGGGRTVIINSTDDESFTIVDLLLVTQLEVSAAGASQERIQNPS